jgi:hypothetical protein
MPRGELNIAIGSLSTLQISPGIVAIFEKIWWRADSYRRLKYRGGCTIPLFQFSVWCEKCVAARNYGNNYSFQMTETGFAEQFYASQDGVAPICLKISGWIAFNSIVNLYRRNGRIQTTSIGTKFIPDFEIFVFNLVWIHSTNLVNITLLHQIPLWNSFQHSCFYYCFLANTGLCLSICTS